MAPVNGPAHYLDGASGGDHSGQQAQSPAREGSGAGCPIGKLIATAPAGALAVDGEPPLGYRCLACFVRDLAVDTRDAAIVVAHP